MAPPSLQWSSAEVSGGVLTVPIEGERPKGWKDKFAQVVTLLGGGPGGEVSCKSGKVRITEVADGTEESLHHFLESVMQETNAAFGAPDEPDQPGDADEGGESDDDSADDSDARLTETFRNFAG
jgi:hypothetical protein